MFLDIRFPIIISKGSSGGPKYQTSIISMKSGQEKRNINWDYPLHEYNAAIGIQKISDLEDVIGFFHICQGSGHSFRWKDFLDYKSCKVQETVSDADQSLGDTDGSIDAVQIYKTYTVGGFSRQSRKIVTPVSGEFVMALDSAPFTDYTLDTDSGLITWDYDTWSIVAVDTDSNTISISGDKTEVISDDDNIEITDSTGNNGVYTVTGTSYSDGKTIITVSGNISDDTVDGNVNHGQPNSGQAITCGFEFDVHARFDSDDLNTNYQEYAAGTADIIITEIKGIEE